MDSEGQDILSKKFSDPFVNMIYRLKVLSFYSLLGGPRIVSLRVVINIFKSTTFLWILLLMRLTNNYSNAMWVYFFLHGSYGLFWLAKDLIIPDSSFKVKVTIGAVINCAVVLLLYWAIPIPLALQIADNNQPVFRLVFASGLYVVGLILMLLSDLQKTLTLKKRKGLISDGLFARTRNPNYLGQVMIYLSFGIVEANWIGYCILLVIWLTMFNMNMYLKDQTSYKFKKGWDEYKKKSYRFFPKLFQSGILNFVLYTIIIGSFLYHEIQYIPAHTFPFIVPNHAIVMPTSS